MGTATTCFTGAWASSETYVAALGGDASEQAEAKQYYDDLREKYECRWFDYLVDGYSVRGFYAKPADQRVSAQSALKMGLKLQELGRPYRLVMFANGGHGLHRTHQDDVTREVVEWFKLKLNDEPGF